MNFFQDWQRWVGPGSGVAVVLLYAAYLLWHNTRPKPAPPKPAVVNCPDCGGKVSSKINTCPHCGRPMEG
jgi:hypothetical protein